MNAQERLVEIHRKYEEFRKATFNPPKYWVMSLEVRQAIQAYAPNDLVVPEDAIATFLGAQIVPLEEAIIVQ